MRATLTFICFRLLLPLLLAPGSGYGQSWPFIDPMNPISPSHALQRPDDQVLVSYEAGTSDLDKETVRSIYQVTSVEVLNDKLELWTNIVLPMSVPDHDDPNAFVILTDIDDMLAHIQNNSTAGHDDARAQVNSGDFNYDIAITSAPPTSFGGSNFLLPECPDELEQLLGENGPYQENGLGVVIMDQAFNLFDPNNFGGSRGYFADLPFNPQPASHADQVAYVIATLLQYSGLTPEFINVPVFDQTGHASYADLLLGFKWLKDNNITNCVVNLSASMVIRGKQNGPANDPIRDYIEDVLTSNNLLLVSSAGNDALPPDIDIFPGTLGFTGEITVAGLESCFQSPWQSTNQNPDQFEISAEANNVWVPVSTTGYAALSGTSYSAPMVSAAVLQLSTHYPTFDPSQLKNRLLETADTEPSAMGIVQDGRVLNTASATDFINFPDLIAWPHEAPIKHATAGHELEAAAEATKEQGVITAYPNPFSQNLTVGLPPLEVNERAQIQLLDQLARPVYHWTATTPAAVLEIPTAVLTKLPPGNYWLKVQTSQSTKVLALSKQ